VTVSRPRTSSAASITRAQSRPTRAASASRSLRGGVPAGGGSRGYQVWYRNAASYCTAATFNLTNGVFVTFAP
jgi:hypothetical protein